jgi:hypothetical protein
MASRQILLISKFAEIWEGCFDMRVTELDKQIGTIDNNATIENATVVCCVEEIEIVPLSRYKPVHPPPAPFSFYTVIN